MEEMKGTVAQNVMNEFRTWGRVYRHRPSYFLFASTVGVTLGVVLAKGLFIPIMRMEEHKKNIEGWKSED